jgi:stress response protein SCP2
MEFKMFTMLLRRANKVLLPSMKLQAKRLLPIVATLELNIHSLGYTFSTQLRGELSKLTLEGLYDLTDKLIPALAEIKGIKNYEPMYPNFPQQVMDAEEFELYTNAVRHYAAAQSQDMLGEGSVWLPSYDKHTRRPLTEKVELMVLRLGSESDMYELASQLSSSNTSLSASDYEDLDALISKGYLPELPETIPHKEVLAFVGSRLFLTMDMSAVFKTATDVLRLAVALSGGDISLAANTQFKSFKRSERRAILSLMENSVSGTTGEDMLRHKAKWIRMGERLHPTEFRHKYPSTAEMFRLIRNDIPLMTFNSSIEQFLLDGEYMKLMLLIVQRPGVFARRLDHIIRKFPDHARDTIATFGTVAHKVSTPVLLQVGTHFSHRDSFNETRLVFPKGSVAKATVLPPLTEMRYDLSKELSTVCSTALITRFKINAGNMGKVYVDPALSSYLVPFSQRSASKGGRSLVRGSQIPLGDKDTVRFFIWWKDMVGGERVDVDLSAKLYDKDWNHIDDIAYYSLQSEGIGCHSGDITSAPNGASEFIDIDIPGFMGVNPRGRYIVMVVNSYTDQKFSDIPEASAGWMMREAPQSGKIYDPQTVVNRIDLTTAATSSIPLVIDLQDRTVIWADLVNLQHNYGNRPTNAHTMRAGIRELGKAITHINKPTLYDLFGLYARANTPVVTPEEADVVFSLENGSQFDTEKIMSQYLK